MRRFQLGIADCFVARNDRLSIVRQQLESKHLELESLGEQRHGRCQERFQGPAAPFDRGREGYEKYGSRQSHNTANLSGNRCSGSELWRPTARCLSSSWGLCRTAKQWLSNHARRRLPESASRCDGSRTASTSLWHSASLWHCPGRWLS